MPTIYNKVVIDGSTLMDISDTTAVAADVAQGKYFYTANGTKTAGTASGSGGGSSSGQTATGTVTGSGTTVLEIPCSFEPDAIYIYGDMSDDISNRGVVSLAIIKDTAIYITSDGSQSSAQENGYVIHGITGYNESNISEVHATYANNVLTVDTVDNTSSMRFMSGLSYTYELSTLGTGGGGSSATLITKTIDANGTYSAQDDSADGYSSVTVNVPPSGITPTGSINIGTNGTHDVTNYASAVVSVPTGGGSSATQHVIHLVLEDETTADVNIYYDDVGVSSIITSSKPTTYNTKTIETASLDGVQWYVHETWETIYENASTQFNSDPPGGYFWISSLSDVYPAVNSIWRITLDDTEYRCTAVRGSSGQIYIGNPYISTQSSEDNIYPDIPFSFYNAGWGAWVGDSLTLQGGTYPLNVERLVTT